jgi:hypothetical protein
MDRERSPIRSPGGAGGPGDTGPQFRTARTDADAGAIPELFDEATPGERYRAGDPADLRRAIEAVVADRDRHAGNCRDLRDAIGVRHGVERVRSVVRELDGET